MMYWELRPIMAERSDGSDSNRATCSVGMRRGLTKNRRTQIISGSRARNASAIIIPAMVGDSFGFLRDAEKPRRIADLDRIGFILAKDVIDLAGDFTSQNVKPDAFARCGAARM